MNNRTSNRRVVVVSGVPGSGKSTLGHRLSPILGLPVLDKDDILNRLFESNGIGDRAWRRKLSRESDMLFEKEANASAGAILVSHWHLPGMPSDSGTPTAWIRELSDCIVNVHCICSPEIAATRFINRTRHAGHLDKKSSYEEILSGIRALAELRPLDIEESIIVDTSEPVNIDELASRLTIAFDRCPARGFPDRPAR